MKIRQYNREDSLEVRELFYNVVHSLKSRDYNRDQINAWAPPLTAPFYKILTRNFSDEICFIAKENGQVVGFGNLTLAGLLENLYVDEDLQRQKVGSSILAKIESGAKSIGLSEITAEVSESAKQAAQNRGFLLVEPFEKKFGNQVLRFYLMKKTI